MTAEFASNVSAEEAARLQADALGEAQNSRFVRIDPEFEKRRADEDARERADSLAYEAAQLRATALNYAVSTCSPSGDHNYVLDTARAYLAFLQGENPKSH